MKKNILAISAILSLLGVISCKNKKNNETGNEISSIETKDTTKSNLAIDKSVAAFIPNGYIISEKVYGDLNNDGLEDCVLIIKGTDKNKIVPRDEGNNELADRNRRGLIILLKRNDNYELAAKNYDCFSSENEDGGGYLPPDLLVEIKKGNLCLHYGHGRYGFWRYTFRLQNSDFELIGYDASENTGPIVDKGISINYLTQKEIIKTNTNNTTGKDGDEIFKKTVKSIHTGKLVKLTEIKDFDTFIAPEVSH